MTLFFAIILVCLLSLGQCGMLAYPGKVITMYNHALLRNPITANMATGSVVLALGDVACQRFIEKKKINPARTLQASIVGCVWSGFGSVEIYKFADRVVGPGQDPKSILLKALVSTVILSTAGNYVNMSMRKLMAGGFRSPKAVFRSINANFAEVSVLPCVLFAR